MAILDLYRIEITDDEILEVAAMADSHGEVRFAKVCNRFIN